MIWLEQKDLLQKLEDEIPELNLEEDLKKIETFGGVDVFSFSSKDIIKFEATRQTKYRSSVNAVNKDLQK